MRMQLLILFFDMKIHVMFTQFFLQEMLLLEIGSSRTVNAMDNIFQLCQQPERVWTLMLHIINGEVDFTDDAKRKEFRKPQTGSYFRGLTSVLSVTERRMLLSRVIDGTYTLKEMDMEATMLKRVKKVMEFIVQDLREETDHGKDKTWEHVKKMYPNELTEDNLNQWVGKNTYSSFDKSGERPVGFGLWIKKLKNIGKDVGQQIVPLNSNTVGRQFEYEGQFYHFFNSDVGALTTLGIKQSFGSI